MFSALLVASLATLAPQEPGTFTDIGQWPANLEVLSSAGRDHFIARNTTIHSQVILVGDAQLGIRARILLPPGGGIQTSFPTGTLDGLTLEVVSLSETGWSRTGGLAFDSMTREGVRAMAVQSQTAPQGSSASLLDAAGWSPLSRSGDLLPSWLPYASSDPVAPPGSEPLVAPPFHVPAVTPGDTQQGDIAPVIDDEPLPEI
jgi:hypothetical protein